MDYISYKTKYANKQNINKQWMVVDASFQPLGRFASQLAYIIRGKHKPNFTPHIDGGDDVIVLNADKIALSGNKSVKKIYTTYSGYPGGLKRAMLQEVQAAHPKRIIEHAVKGMLPKNRLGRRLFHHLHVYEGAVHPHTAQQPTPITLKY